MIFFFQIFLISMATQASQCLQALLILILFTWLRYYRKKFSALKPILFNSFHKRLLPTF